MPVKLVGSETLLGKKSTNVMPIDIVKTPSTCDRQFERPCHTNILLTMNSHCQPANPKTSRSCKMPYSRNAISLRLHVHSLRVVTRRHALRLGCPMSEHALDVHKQ